MTVLGWWLGLLGLLRVGGVREQGLLAHELDDLLAAVASVVLRLRLALDIGTLARLGAFADEFVLGDGVVFLTGEGLGRREGQRLEPLRRICVPVAGGLGRR